MYIYIFIDIYTIYMYIYIFIYILDIYINSEKLLEIFYIVTNSFTLPLDNDPRTIRGIMKNL